MYVERLYLHSCTIQVRTLGAADSRGKAAVTWATEEENVPCMFYYPEELGVKAAEGEVLDFDLMAFFPPTTTLSGMDRRVVSTQTGFTGTFEIKKVIPRSEVQKNGATALHHYEAGLTRIQVGV